jgi:GNAT superfamily N-acetyltransferase
MIKLRKAESEEAEDILRFYRNVIDTIKGTQFNPKWSEAYPNLEFIETSIEKGELYVLTDDNGVIASAVLNSRFDPEYSNVNWYVDAEPDEITVIHAFAVSSDMAGKGIGKEIFNQIKDEAMKNNQKAIRLDIIDGNYGAEEVFRKLGFEYVCTVEVFHEIVGLEKFQLYEYDLTDF